MISAVILSGGRSRRMGQDKAGLVLEGQTFLERIMTQLKDIKDLYLSVGRQDPYSDCSAAHIQDDYQECGPMGGIQKALSVCKYENLFVTGCDMPFMDSEFAFYLAGFLTDDADAVIPVGRDGRRYVLGAIYHRRVGKAIEARLQKGDRKLTNLLEDIKVVYVRLETPEQERKLMNINDQTEYLRILRQKEPIPVISFVGYSNTGKTTLIEKIISVLKRQGIRTAYIKHTHHRIQFPTEGKDSERMTAAGAEVSAVVSLRGALIAENREVDIHRLLQTIDHVDIILIEGYKQESFPQILVAENGCDSVPVSRCLAVVSDRNPGEDDRWFSRDDAEGISRFILEYFNLRREKQ